MATHDHPELINDLADPSAAQWNRDLLTRFQTELEKNPKADLLDMFPKSYVHAHRVAKYEKLPYLAHFNLRTLHKISDELRKEPEMNLLAAFPKGYQTKISWSTSHKIPSKVDAPERPDIRESFNEFDSAKIVFPLSKEVSCLLKKHTTEPSPEVSQLDGEALAATLKRLLLESQMLWQGLWRRAVIKCATDVVAKLITFSEDYTEYTSMQYLAAHAPEIPAPRPLGLIEYGYFNIIFMSYIPGITLTQAWPSLDRNAKLSIREELDALFCRLRNLKQEEGKCMGEVNGGGVKELRINECALFPGISTSKQFQDLQFSARQNGSQTYVALLQSLLCNKELQGGSVFTHGDVRTDNIIVTKNDGLDNNYRITGIIDWEDSGFYPTWHECTTLTRTMSVRLEDDWYNYIPASISPSRFPARWLVYLLWDFHLRTV